MLSQLDPNHTYPIRAYYAKRSKRTLSRAIIRQMKSVIADLCFIGQKVLELQDLETTMYKAVIFDVSQLFRRTGELTGLNTAFVYWLDWRCGDEESVHCHCSVRA